MNLHTIISCPYCHKHAVVLALTQIDMIRRILRSKVSETKMLQAIVLIVEDDLQ